MDEKKAKRKLTAILSADVKGYSHLMQDDEEATVRTITAYRGVMSTLIQEHDGRVVDAKGDNVLAEFASVVDSVRCGVEIQKELKVRNDELTENRKMEFRIGINLGDVIQEEETIYGDGVNIAARLEGLAEGGGICISRMAFDNVKNKLNVGYEYLGEHSVKNIAEPVRVYKVLMEPEYAGKVVGEERPKPKQWRWAAIAIGFIVVVGALAIWNFYFRPPPIEPASADKMAYPLPDKPSIAVLPFVNMSDDPKQEYFSDGITEEIITGLSKIPKLFVIARNSTFTYKDKPVKVQQVAEELSVRYVLEGSVRKAGDKVRIAAQLVDATIGHHLWSERYDRDMKDIFAIQDEITKEIMTALQVKLTMGEEARLFGRSTNNLEAYLKLLEGREYFLRFTKNGNIQGRKAFDEAIALDPEYAYAYGMLAWTYLLDVSYGWTESMEKSFERASELVQKALTLDDSISHTYLVLSGIHLRKGEIKEAISLRQKAVALNPNSASNHAWLAVALTFGGRHEEAIEEFKKAIRLNPFPPNWFLHYLGAAYRVIGQYEKAIETFKKVIERDPDFWLSHWGLAACYGLMSREEEARKAAAEVLRIRPKFSLAKVRGFPYRDKADKERCLKALRRAGLK